MKSISLLFGVVVVIISRVVAISASEAPFDANYFVQYGGDHVTFFNQTRVAQLSLDTNSGARFASKRSYGSGIFEMMIKLPWGDSAGVVTAFYLTSNSNTQNGHDELDFEFLGNRLGKPIALQTNVFAEDVGNREQKIFLWFDPTADFHSYKILWNQHQIIFYVDNIPIRVFKNNKNIGVGYPSSPMQIQCSIWNGESWATDGGKSKIDWSKAPFKAEFQGFNVYGCAANPNSKADHCDSPDRYTWNKKWELDSREQSAYNMVRQKYMFYDYCTDFTRFRTRPRECL